MGGFVSPSAIVSKQNGAGLLLLLATLGRAQRVCVMRIFMAEELEIKPLQASNKSSQ